MFRLKIALLSVLVSGATLIFLGAFFLATVNRVGMDRIDREIRTLGESQLYDWHPRKDWLGFESSLRSIYGKERWKILIAQVTGPDHDLLYRSPHWPAEIGTDSFPAFNDTMETFPEHRVDRPPRPAPPPPPPPDKPGPRARPSREKEGRPNPPPPRNIHPRARIKNPVFKTIDTASGEWRTAIMGSQHITLLIGMNMSDFHADAAKHRNAFFIAVPLAMVLLGFGGWLVAHRAITPVTDITRTAKQITAKGLDQRIITAGTDVEFTRLVQVINEMLERLDKSFQQAVRFSADAAHELQTPLTILQGNLDNAVQSAAFGSDEQRRYSSLLEDVGRLKNIVRKLLILAQADAGRLPLRLTPVDISSMVESAAEDAEVIGPRLSIETEILPGLIVPADPDLLRMVLQGVMANAVKYNTKNGMIRFELRVENGNALLSVANTGPSVPENERENLFKRFYRADPSRNRKAPGAGLGLSLAREILHAHNGDIRLVPSSENRTVFVLTLPLAG